jgi:hypothetical protein
MDIREHQPDGIRGSGNAKDQMPEPIHLRIQCVHIPTHENPTALCRPCNLVLHSRTRGMMRKRKEMGSIPVNPGKDKTGSELDSVLPTVL